MSTSNPRYALISVMDKTGIETFAQRLIDHGFKIIASGNTWKHLTEHGIEVVSVKEITGLDPVLKHRVVTLAPEIHGGLLANDELYPELCELGWRRISVLCVDFYPLEAELAREGATFESCIEKTDIGGPAMVRSCNKGGKRFPLTKPEQRDQFLAWMDAGEPQPDQISYRLSLMAERHVADYCAASAEVYERFKCDQFKGEPLTNWFPDAIRGPGDVD